MVLGQQCSALPAPPAVLLEGEATGRSCHHRSVTNGNCKVVRCHLITLHSIQGRGFHCALGRQIWDSSPSLLEARPPRASHVHLCLVFAAPSMCCGDRNSPKAQPQQPPSALGRIFNFIQLLDMGGFVTCKRRKEVQHGTSLCPCLQTSGLGSQCCVGQFSLYGVPLIIKVPDTGFVPTWFTVPALHFSVH